MQFTAVLLDANNSDEGTLPAVTILFQMSALIPHTRNLPATTCQLQFTGSVDMEKDEWTCLQLEQYARQEGVELSISTLGPGFHTLACSTHNHWQFWATVKDL